jgi:ABC-type transport system involved in multi-copper enzyme maturation permease subunit
MIWLTWRQFRVQAISAAVVLAVAAVYLVILGAQIRHTYNTDLALCRTSQGGCTSLMAEFTNKYKLQVELFDVLLIVAPGIIGIFWGAPLVARELEAGTLRLVWNQSVTRRRWLATKLLVLALASMAAAGLSSLLLTWAAAPVDRIQADRFHVLLFGARNIVPVAYAAFAFVLGTSVGLVIRRTVPAMAVTLVVFAVVQVLVPTMLRPHLITPVTGTLQMTTSDFAALSFLGQDADISGLQIPGAWVVSTSDLLAPDGQRVNLQQYNDCVSGSIPQTSACLAKLDLHVQVAYEPPDRYWDLQWLESGVFLLLGALLAGFALWRIQGRLG